MAKRKALSKKLRFEVFLRDEFTCQYCGRAAPSVVLELEHIVPVSRGGGNDKCNLTTACEECNAGKNAKLITFDRNLPYGRFHETAPEAWGGFIRELRTTLCNQIRVCNEAEYRYFAIWLHLCLRNCETVDEIRVIASHSTSILHMGDMLKDHFVTLNADLNSELSNDHTLLWPLCVVRHILKAKYGPVKERYITYRVHRLIGESISAEDIIEDAWISSTFQEWLDVAEDRIRTACGCPSIAEEEEYDEELEGVTDGQNTNS